MARRLIFIVGGARSGKSALALRMADGCGSRKVYLATAQALDEEMRRRIARHRKERPGAWRTVEEPFNVPATLRALSGRCDAVVIDCLTLWLANMLGEEGTSEEAVLEGVRSMLEASREAGCTVVVVSNEVGGGIVPENALARLYRDVMGSANQMVAEAAEEVFQVVAGIPIRLKPSLGGRMDA